jgi:hypothetical protein
MSLISFKNIWGSAGSSTDQQRADLFVISLNFPAGLSLGNNQSAGVNIWDSEVAFAVQDFPFPARSREMIPIKYLNQTNLQLGADTAMAPIDITVRWAFNRRTAELLERWNWATSNPITGGVAQSSAIKSSGTFWWLIPNTAEQLSVDDITATNVMQNGPSYFLEGLMVKELTPSHADMKSSDLVSLKFSLQIDRYYPLLPDNLTIPGAV